MGDQIREVRLRSILDQVRDHVSSDLDARLRSAIAAHLGTENFDLKELTGRCTHTEEANGHETWWIDKVAILAADPPLVPDRPGFLTYYRNFYTPKKEGTNG